MFGNFGWFMLIGSAPFLIAIVLCIAMFAGIGWFMLRGNRRETLTDMSVPRDQQSYEQADQLPLRQAEGTYQEGGVPQTYAQTEEKHVHEQPRR